ncbi:MAG TPA: SDR family oxidoreductase, partial [Spirochaetota bacterium]|nr:SDR family oxidoreductase [Spirochaetota bacterium]
IGKPLEIINTPIKQWDAIMRINLRSALIMIKNVYPLFLNSNVASIVNISSEQSFYPQKGFAPYAVSKSGINMLTQCAAQELLDKGIRVNAIALGTVKTNILNSLTISGEEQEKMFAQKDKTIPFGLMETRDVYKVVEFLLSQKSKYITGTTILCDGGMHLI